MITSSIRFLGLLFATLLLFFIGHIGVLYFLEAPLFQNRIILSYSVNYLLALGLLYFVQSNFNKQASNTAFIFLLGSAIKFGVFFILFYPHYNADSQMQTTEFAAFFVPYAICLTLEVLFLSKELNNKSYS
jgi:Na+-translocating ferredoxin:NAD+ oxidoreductase RnfD subunit